METKDRANLEQENAATLERWFQALARNDVDAACDLLHDDHIAEYPQSGERISGRGDWRKIGENYPGGLPGMIDYSYELSGDLGVGGMFFEYGDDRVRVCAIFELQGGKLKKTREYFAEPFEAPWWRAQCVERMR